MIKILLSSPNLHPRVSLLCKTFSIFHQALHFITVSTAPARMDPHGAYPVVPRKDTTPNLKESPGDGLGVNTAEPRHTGAPSPQISRFLPRCSPLCFSNFILEKCCLIYNMLLNIQKEARGSSSHMGKMMRMKMRRLKEGFVPAALGKAQAPRYRPTAKTNSYLTSSEAPYLPQDHTKGKFAAL